MTPADVFKSFDDAFLRKLAIEVLEQEHAVVRTDTPAQAQALEILQSKAKIRDLKTAERQVAACTRNEVFVRWLNGASEARR
jgi:hypothetical protein